MDTPRRAGASGAEADDGYLHRAGEIDHPGALGLGRPDAGAGVEEDHIGQAETLSADPGELVGEDLERPPRPVPADAQAEAPQRGRAGAEGPPLAGTGGGGGQDPDLAI